MSNNAEDLDLYTVVDEELYDELAELAGQKVVYVEVWEESLGDLLAAAAEPEAVQDAFDIDLYLEGGIYFELYSVLCYPDLESEPLLGLEPVQERLVTLAKGGLWLEEVAVDEENGLVLVLARQHRVQLYLVIGGWAVAEWDELPSE
ncbi:MAG: hypothetical protein R3C14_29070 [Caldilineaceae bacterium]